jgi:hypothetical protein
VTRNIGEKTGSMNVWNTNDVHLVLNSLLADCKIMTLLYFLNLRNLLFETKQKSQGRLSMGAVSFTAVIGPKTNNVAIRWSTTVL